MDKKKTMGIDFKADIEISRFRLEEESEVQPALYYCYAEKLAKKKALRDRTEAKMQLAIRANPEKYAGAAKLTEDFVKAIIKGDDEMAALNEEVLLLDAAVSALEDRRSQLKNLTELYMAGYFATVDQGRKPDAGDAVQGDIRGHLKSKKRKEEE